MNLLILGGTRFLGRALVESALRSDQLRLARRAGPGRAAAVGLDVLLEDDDVLRGLVRRALTGAGYRVVEAPRPSVATLSNAMDVGDKSGSAGIMLKRRVIQPLLLRVPLSIVHRLPHFGAIFNTEQILPQPGAQCKYIYASCLCFSFIFYC